MSCKRSNELSWVAGVVEKGSTITIGRQIQHGNWTYCGRLYITSRNRSVVEECRRILGVGSVGRFNPHTGRRYWRLTLYGENAATALRLVLPYLRVKREHAEVMLAFQESEARQDQYNHYRKIRTLHERRR